LTSGTIAVRRPSLLIELLIGVATFAVYLLVESVGGVGRQAAALANGEWIFRTERSLHLDLELSANRWLDRHDLVRVLFNYEYGTTYAIVAFGLLFWLLWKRPDEYRRARTSFVVLNLIAFACFWLYPVMPPRLLSGHGFVDTVTAGNTVGSWGTPLVSDANQLAAMPSLHVAWALWVSVVLARLSGRRLVQVISALHVALTLCVVVTTANHYVLDAVGAAVLVLLAVSLPYRLGSEEEPVPAADAFFLRIESPSWPQQVGGVVPLDVAGGPVSHARVVEVVKNELHRLPRFRQVLYQPESRWARTRWRNADPLDWDWHVPLIDLSRPDGTPGGQAAFDRLVAELAGTELPRDRPLWRLVVVHGVEPDQAAVVLIVHHVVADGIGTVAQALHLLRPILPDPFAGAGARGPGRLARGVGVAVGLGQLATDGTAPQLWTIERPVSERGNAAREFRRVTVSLADVRSIARSHQARVSDVLMCAVAGGLARLELPGSPERFRVAVPLMVREPGAAAEGNVTAAVMIDLPIASLIETDRLKIISRRSARLRTPTRALASRWVMASVGGLMPVPLHGWFARTVYGSRYFNGIVSNMPGPAGQLSLAGTPVVAAYPLLPLAPETPLVVGTLGWNGELCISVTTGDRLLPYTDELIAGLHATLAELGVAEKIRDEAAS
jgi:diacylglycerol O-acyltransferase